MNIRLSATQLLAIDYSIISSIGSTSSNYHNILNNKISRVGRLH